MTVLAKQTIELIKMLPDEELRIIHALTFKIVKAWDPEFTKVTAEERKKLEIIDLEISNGKFFLENEVFD